ncbi:MAG: hypothetical protein KC736_01775 [Candidatus Moranbacteria bacterium]|nr:hypothetical protein [Candidatus Moranbacteria bacterium]
MKSRKTIMYQAKNGALELHGDLDTQTVWASQKQMAEVFDVDTRTINEHIIVIYNRVITT